MTDMVESLRTQEQRDALVLCYRVLANEAYREALGNNRNSINSMTNKYDDEKATILVFWARNQFLSSIDLERDINSSISSNKCRRVIDKLYTLLTYAKNNLRSNNQRILSEITLTDLQNVINLSLLIPSLEAMHDTAAGFLNHQNQNCIMNPQLIEAMQQAANGV